MPGRPSGERPDHTDLIDAARRCFVRDGYEATGMRGIAEEAGTSVSRLYLAFANKHAVLLAVHEASSERLVNEYLLPAMTQNIPPWDRVMALVEAYLQFYLEERELSTMMVITPIDPSSDDPATRALIRSQREQIERLALLMTEITRETGSDIDPMHVVRWCWGAVLGMASINMRLPHLGVGDDELDRIVGVGMRFVRAGLREAGQLEARPASEF